MTGTVKLYSFVYSIAGAMYSGQIPAQSWAEAESLVPFALVDGELVEERPLGMVCSICGGDVIKDLSNPQPVIRGDEWPEEFE